MMRTYFRRLGLALGAILGAVAIGIALDNDLGIPIWLTYRVACAIICLGFIFKLQRDYPEERWPRIAFVVSAIFNVALFFTPIVDRPASRGDIMLFALPDAVVVLVAAIASYQVTDIHQRAVRQQMIFGLIVALVFCVILFSLTLIEPHSSTGR